MIISLSVNLPLTSNEWVCSFRQRKENLCLLGIYHVLGFFVHIRSFIFIIIKADEETCINPIILVIQQPQKQSGKGGNNLWQSLDRYEKKIIGRARTNMVLWLYKSKAVGQPVPVNYNEQPGRKKKIGSKLSGHSLTYSLLLEICYLNFYLYFIHTCSSVFGKHILIYHLILGSNSSKVYEKKFLPHTYSILTP